MNVKSVAKTAVKDLVLGKWLPGVYQLAAEAAPVDPRKALFVAQKGHKLSDNYELMFHHLRCVYGLDVRFVALRYDEVSYPAYLRNCAAFLREAATARFVFLDDASDIMSCVNLREGTNVVQLWHACGAFKKFGLSTSEKLFGGTRAEKLRHPFYANLSLVTVSSPQVAWAYREAMDLDDPADRIPPDETIASPDCASPAGEHAIVQATGVSRTDVYFDEGFRAAASTCVRAALPAAGKRKIVLYAPTFRGDSAHAAGPDQLDVRALKRALGNEWFLVVKHHPFVKNPPAIPDDCADFACMAPAGTRIDELLCAADACVTDYSSIVFEYALLDRPLAFFAYDLANYDDWRGFYYDYDAMTPGPVVSTTAELADYLAHVDERYDAQAMAEFRTRFMSACDGHATARIAQTIMRR